MTTVQVDSEEGILQRVLSQRLGLSMAQVTVTRLAGDVSSRRYYRGTLNQNFNFVPSTHGMALPAASESHIQGWMANSVIMTVYPEPFDLAQTAQEELSSKIRKNPSSLLSYANSPNAQLEQTFFLLGQRLPVPRILFVQDLLQRWNGAGPVGLIVFEDFGDARLLEVLMASSSSDRQEWYGRAVELIAQMHNTTEAVTRSSLVANALYFSPEKLLWEMNYFLDHYFSSYRHTPLSDVERASFMQELHLLCRRLSEYPRVLCHRDFHARNLMVKDNRLFLIDYQDARLGPTTYDLVSLLLDPYAPTEGLDVSALILRYRNARQGSLPAVPEGDAFEKEWTEMAAQRLLKAAGTYAYMAGAKGVAEFQGYLEPTLKRASALLQKLGGFEKLLNALS